MVHLPNPTTPPQDTVYQRKQHAGKAATHQCTAMAMAMAATLSRRAPKLNSCRTSEILSIHLKGLPCARRRMPTTRSSLQAGASHAPSSQHRGLVHADAAA